MEQKNNKILSLGDTVEMPEPSTTTASEREALFFKLKLKVSGNGKKIELYYSHAACVVAGGDRLAVLNGFFSGNSKWEICKHNRKPHKSPLTIFNDKPRYIFIVLDDQSWQFSSEHVPFMIDKNFSSTYSFARRYVKDTNDQYVEVKGSNKLSNCMIAGFIADNQQIQDSGQYSAPFNIYLDLLLTDWEGKPVPLPIVVDPDVGHPGGNGPP